MLFSVNTLLIIAVVIGFYKAWNIGANDVANGMGTVVGAGTLTLRQAIMLASVFEFLGAFLVGANVTDTIKGGIVSLETFSVDPHVFGVGMLAVALSSAIWLHIATSMSRPVSVTQSTIGGIIGFAIAVPIGGPGCVHWGHVGTIALTWITSPLVGAAGAYLIYKCIIRFVLASRHPVFMSKAAVPIGLAATLSIIFLSATCDGLRRISLYHAKGPSPLTLGQYVAVVAGLCLVSYGVTRWVINHRTQDSRIRLKDRYAVVEQWFGRLQVLTACYMSFAHGANDVASAIGPLAGSMQAFGDGHLSVQAAVSPWLLAFGGVGIVLGLATMGYKVILAVGKSITEITPTRGFSAEFATASTVLVCSKLGLPISTTFVMVGAIMGVGFARGFGALDMRVIRRIFGSWILTLPMSAMMAAFIFWIMRSVIGL